MKRLFFIISIFAISLLVLLTGCAKKEVKKEQVVIRMVFVPASEKGDENDFVSLLDIIGKITGYKMETVKVTDYNAAVEAMRAGRADMAWFGAKTYIEASKIADAEAFAAGIPKGKESVVYHTHFIVKKDSPLKEFTKKELTGKILALNHVGSTSGDLIPRYELLQIGLDTKDKNSFKMVQYAGSHDAAILTVLNGIAEVAGVSSVNWDARIKDGTIKAEDFRIIHSSPPIAGAPLAYSKKLPLEVRQKIKTAVLDAHNHGTIGGYGGEMEKYVSVTDADYEITRKISTTVK